MTFIVQQYDGPPRPGDRIAVIRIDAGGPEVIAVDDVPLHVPLEKPNRIHVEVLPGPHEVDVEVTEPEIGLRHVLPIRFVAEADKVYRVEVLSAAPGVESESRWDARAYEVDRSSDAKLNVAPAAAAPSTAQRGAPPPASAAPAQGTDADAAADADRAPGEGGAAPLP
jgi:hypothetical protein